MQTFSGGYVHVLKGALSEDLLIQSFQKMGYVRRDAHRLMVAALPPARQLVQVALGCFALRLECEILGEVLAQLGTSVLPAEELLQARRASVDVASCVAWLQQRLAREEEPPPLPRRGSPTGCQARLDLYRDVQEDEGSDEASLYGGPSPGPDSPTSELACQPRFWEQSARLWGAGGGPWEPAEVSSPTSGASEEEEPQPEAFSFLSLRRELLSRPGDLALPMPLEALSRPARHPSQSPLATRCTLAWPQEPCPPSAATRVASCTPPTVLPFPAATPATACAPCVGTASGVCGCSEPRWTPCSTTALRPGPRPTWPQGKGSPEKLRGAFLGLVPPQAPPTGHPAPPAMWSLYPTR